MLHANISLALPEKSVTKNLGEAVFLHPPDCRFQLQNQSAGR